MADRQMSQMGMSSRQYSGEDRQMSMNMGMDRRMDNNNRQMSMYNDNVDQYYKRDDFGNYAYGYTNGNSEKYEVGNPQGGVKGHYMYVD